MKHEITAFSFAKSAESVFQRESAEFLFRKGMALAGENGSSVVAFVEGVAIYTFQRSPYCGDLPDVLRNAEQCILRTATGSVIAICVMTPEQA